ncbi:MAG: MbnP family protein [Crocinitomicaceae bacterium]
MKKILFLALAASTLLLNSCKKEGCTDSSANNYSEKAKKDDGTCTYDVVEETGKVTLMLEHTWATSGINFELGTEYIHPTTNDALTFTTLKYYISNLKLKKDDGTWWTQPNSYFLVNLETPASTMIDVTGIPSGNYTEVSYVLGVDSTRNVSGAQDGALSTTNAMFWSWNSGYIMVKAEGTSPQSSTGSFAYHLGGFSGTNNIVTSRSDSFGTEKLIVSTTSAGMIHFSVDPSALFNNFGSVSTNSNVQMPGMMAKTLATGYYSGFAFEHIHN